MSEIEKNPGSPGRVPSAFFTRAEGGSTNVDAQVRDVLRGTTDTVGQIQNVLGNMLSKVPPLPGAAKLKAFQGKLNTASEKLDAVRGIAPVAAAVDETPETVQPKHP